MADSGKGFIYSIIGFFVGLGMIYSGTKRFLLVQKIKDTPTSKVEGAAVGLTELSGTARCHDPTPSPISGVGCAYWKLDAQYYQSGKNGGWRNFFKSDSRKQFYIVDDTGEMLVDPAGAEIDIPLDATYQGYPSGTGVFGVAHGPIDPRVLKFIDTLDEAGKKKFANVSHLDIRVIESYIADNDPLYVLGSAEPLEGSSSAIASENLFIRKGDIDKTMYISDSGERAILEKLSGSMYWLMFGGLGLSAVCLLIIFMYLGML